MKASLFVMFAAGFLFGAVVWEHVFLHRYAPAGNFPYIHPTPAYLLKQMPDGVFTNYHVVLEPNR